MWTREGGRDLLHGFPVSYSSNMPALPTATSAGVVPVLFGSFQDGYIIGDRGGAGTEGSHCFTGRYGLVRFGIRCFSEFRCGGAFLCLSFRHRISAIEQFGPRLGMGCARLGQAEFGIAPQRQSLEPFGCMARNNPFPSVRW